MRYFTGDSSCFNQWQNTLFPVSLVVFKDLGRNRHMDLFSPAYFAPTLHYANLFLHSNFSVFHLCNSSAHPVSVPPSRINCSAFAQLLPSSLFTYLQLSFSKTTIQISALLYTPLLQLTGMQLSFSLNTDPLPCCFSLKLKERKEGNKAHQHSCLEFRQGLD